MTKGIKYGALSVVASALLSTSAIAGTVNTGNYTIANEYINGQASGAIDVANKLFVVTNTGDALTTNDNTVSGYSPTTIPAISLANGTVTLSASSGNLADGTDATHTLVIMEDNAAVDSDVVIAAYANTFGGKLSFASDASVSFTNGKSYRLATVLNANATIGGTLADANSPAPAASDVTLSGVAINTETVTFTTELFSTDTQTLRDTASAVFVTTPVQMSASVSTSANGVIDAINAEQKLFTGGVDNDTIGITVNAALLDTGAAAVGDDATIVITSSKALPVGMTAVMTAVNGATVANAGVCAISTDRMTTTCSVSSTDLAGGDSEVYTVTFTQPVADRNAIKDASFTALVTHDFQADADFVDYTTAAPLLNASAGAWTYNGYNAKVPYISNDGQYTSTFVKLVNKNTLAANVTADLQDDAGHQCHGVALAALPANQAKVYFDADITTAAHATTGVTGDACASIEYPYAVEIFATVNPANVETVAVQKFGAYQGQRVLPVYTNRNADANGVRDGK